MAGAKLKVICILLGKVLPLIFLWNSLSEQFFLKILLKKLKKIFYNRVDEKELGVTKLKFLNANRGK